MTRFVFVLTLVGLTAGCGSGEQPTADSSAPAADAQPEPIDVGEIKPVAEYLAEERYATADLDKGRRLFLQCRACHSLDAGGAHKVGPNLHGMFGQAAASNEGYSYSPALTEAAIVWTPKALEEWLIRPSSFIPGNKMAFAGIKKEADRTDLLAYVMVETSKAE